VKYYHTTTKEKRTKIFEAEAFQYSHKLTLLAEISGIILEINNGHFSKAQ